jgi:hypothetical protein
MDRDAPVMRQHLVRQWEEANGTLERLAQGASARPTDAWTIIKIAAAASVLDVVRFEMSPVVFNVPERANHSSSELFVVAEGWLELRREEFRQSQTLVTHAFVTQAGYFRWSGNSLDHVYGAHYDVAVDQLGHPTFHSQMRSFEELGRHIATHYSIDSPINNHIKGVLRNVRLPTAQMDFFSFVLQVFADHLLIDGSTQEERAAFNALLAKNELLKGAAKRSGRLTAEIARSCYRALHWYPVVT